MGQVSFKESEWQQVRLFIGTPMYGGMCNGMFCRSIADLSSLSTHRKVQLQLHFLMNESLITRARNYIVDEFLRSNATHLMFIDADIGFNAQDVHGLVMLATKNPEYHIIGAAYPKKCIAWEKVRQAALKGLGEREANDLEKYVGDFVFNPKQGTSEIKINEPVEVLEIGTGFMLIRRDTMEKFRDHYWEQYKYRPDHVRTTAFDGTREIIQAFQAEVDQVDFRTEYEALITKAMENPEKATETLSKGLQAIADIQKDKSKRYLSEDYWFCQRAHAIGIKTWLCPWVRLNHAGTYIFGGSLQDLAIAGTAATADPGQLKKPKK